MRLRFLFRPKAQDAFLLLLVAYCGLAVAEPSRLLGVAYQQGDIIFYDGMRSAMFSVFPLCLLQAPVFLLYISRTVSWFSSPDTALRCRSAYRLVLGQNAAAAFLCAVFTAFSYLLVLLACGLYGQLHTVEPVELLACFALQCLSFLALAQITFGLRLLTKSPVAAFAGTYLLFAVEFALHMMGAPLAIPILVWIETFEITSAYFSNLVSALMLNGGLYFGISLIAERREWYPVQR